MKDPTTSTLKFTDDQDLLEEAQERDLIAAGPWQEGEPNEEGRYLIEYEQHGQTGVFIGDWGLHRNGDELEMGWSSLPDAEVLRYAPIHT